MADKLSNTLSDHIAMINTKESHPISLVQSVQSKMSIYRNYCVKMGNIFQFVLTLNITTAFDGLIAEPGSVPLPKVFDTSITGSTSIIDAHSLNGGRIRITKDGSLYTNNVATGTFMYCATYIIND